MSKDFNKEALKWLSPGPFAYIHLQWFAAEDEGRTEEPTEHKLRKAREEGRVAKSVELNSAILLIFSIGAIAILAGYLLDTFLAMFNYFFTRSTETTLLESGILVQAFFDFFIRLLAPLLLLNFIISILANLIQVGFLFTVKPLIPDFSRIVPHFGRYFKRVLFSAEGLFNLAKSLVKVFIIGFIAYLNIQAESKKLLTLLYLPVGRSFSFVAELVLRIILEAAIFMLALSVLDYIFQRWQFRENMKMSRQELKEERKIYEGDPLIKSRLKERMREIMMRNMLKAVPKADVIITNPTHFAVALEWDRLTMHAPQVTAKGADLIAQKIKDLALAHNIPVVENKPLARALYDEVEIGETIPEKYYEAIATILAQIYKMKGEVKVATG